MNAEDERAYLKLEAFIQVAFELHATWTDVLNPGYPKCLPGFEEFLLELCGWRDKVKDAKAKQ